MGLLATSGLLFFESEALAGAGTGTAAAGSEAARVLEGSLRAGRGSVDGPLVAAAAPVVDETTDDAGGAGALNFFDGASFSPPANPVASPAVAVAVVGVPRAPLDPAPAPDEALNPNALLFTNEREMFLDPARGC
jgi:hypothetical protein